MSNQKIQSTVQSVQGNGMDRSGEYYQFEYTFEDGTVLSARHKSEQPKAQVGELAEYQVKFENDYGKVGSVSKPYNQNGGGGGGYQQRPQPPAQNYSQSNSGGGRSSYQKSGGKGKEAAFALAYAKDIVMTEIEAGNPIGDENAIADRALRIAERFNVWLNNN